MAKAENCDWYKDPTSQPGEKCGRGALGKFVVNEGVVLPLCEACMRWMYDQGWDLRLSQPYVEVH